MEEVTRVTGQFDTPEQKIERVDNGSLSVIARAEIDMAISTAKRYPRTLSVVKKNMMTFATLDQETAESCFYLLPRGDKKIKGPSIRLAEIALSCYGNIRTGSRVIDVDSTSKNPHVVVQAAAHDLENNIHVTMEKRRRIFKKKKNNWIDEDDINLAANAASAIALRDAIFKVVPLALVKPVFDAAVKVAVGDAKTLVERRNKCIDTFGKMGIFKERVLAKLEKKSIEDVTLEDLETLIGLHNAIRDEEMTLDEAFPEPKLAEAKKADEPAKAEAADPKKSEEQSAAQPPPEPAPTPQQSLEKFIVSNGFDFSILMEWAKDTGHIPDPTSVPSFDEIPTEVAKRLLKGKLALIPQLAQVKAKSKPQGAQGGLL